MVNPRWQAGYPGTSAVRNPGAVRWLVAVPGDGSAESSSRTVGTAIFKLQIGECKLQIWENVNLQSPI